MWDENKTISSGIRNGSGTTDGTTEAFKWVQEQKAWQMKKSVKTDMTVVYRDEETPPEDPPVVVHPSTNSLNLWILIQPITSEQNYLNFEGEYRFEGTVRIGFENY